VILNGISGQMATPLYPFTQYEHISVAEGLKRLARKQAVLSLGLMKAKDSGAHSAIQPPYLVHLRRLELIQVFTRGAWSADPRGSPGTRTINESTKHRQPGRGGRPGAYMSEAFGG